MKKELVYYAQYNELVVKAIAKAVALAPLILLLLALFIYFDVIETTRFYRPVYLIILFFALVGLSLFHFIQKKPNVYRFLGFVTCVLFFALFIGGAKTLLFLWMILMTIGILNYGKRMLVWLTGLLIASYVLEGVYEYIFVGTNEYYSNAAFVLLTIITSVLVSNIILALKTDYINITRFRREENFQYAQTQALLDSIDDGIISIDNKGFIQVFNAATLNIFDTNKNIAHEHISDIIFASTKDGKKVNIFDYIKKQHKSSTTEQYFHTFTNGEKMRFHLTVSVVQAKFDAKKQAPKGYILIIRDITKAKSLEEERDDFISVISHELRTPVTITEGALSNLQIMAQKEAVDPNIIKGINSSYDQVLYLSSLINDLSSLARADREEQVRTELIDVQSFMKQLYLAYQHQARDQGLMMNIDTAPNLGALETNRLYLEEIMQNLIANAIKYTKQGSITVAVTQDSQTTTFSVVDTGIGIAKSDHENIFKKFYRSEDYRTRETSGTGLGLYVCQRLAERLGAHITVQSRLHHGSTFSLIFPTSPPSQ